MVPNQRHKSETKPSRRSNREPDDVPKSALALGEREEAECSSEDERKTALLLVSKSHHT